LPTPFVQAESFRRTQKPKIPDESVRLRFDRIENRCCMPCRLAIRDRPPV